MTLIGKSGPLRFLAPPRASGENGFSSGTPLGRSRPTPRRHDGPRFLFGYDGDTGTDNLDGGDGSDTCQNGKTLTSCEDVSGRSGPFRFWGPDAENQRVSGEGPDKGGGLK